jgi:hypothetical protein
MQLNANGGLQPDLNIPVSTIRRHHQVPTQNAPISNALRKGPKSRPRLTFETFYVLFSDFFLRLRTTVS